MTSRNGLFMLLLGLTALFTASCNDSIIDNGGIGDPPPKKEDTIFHLQWASALDPTRSIVSAGTNGVVYDSLVIFFGDIEEPARLMAFDINTGEKLWEYRYDGWDNTNVDYNYYHNGTLVCVTAKRVFGFDIETRTVVWEEDLRARNMLRNSGKMGKDGMFYMTAYENFDPLGGFTSHLMRFDPHSGEMDIVVSYAPDSIGTKSVSPPVYWRDGIIVYNLAPNAEVPPDEGSQVLVAYDMQTREELWRVPVVENFASNGLHPPAIYDDRIVITGGGHHIFGFDLETGRQLWKYSLPGYTFGGGFWTTTNHLLHNDRLYVNALSEEVTCLDPRTGREIWNNLEGGANCTDNMVFYEPENVLVLTSWGYGSVMILDADTGETLHREHRYEDSSYGSDPVYDPETDMFFTSTYWHAVAFKVERPDG